MEKKSLLQGIDNYLLGNTVNNSLFNLFNDIKTYLAEDSIPVELPVMQKIAEGKQQGKITISRTSGNVEMDYITIDIAIGNKHLRGKMNMLDYANTITGFARQPIEIEFSSNFSA